jgi:hypothetical protein
MCRNANPKNPRTVCAEDRENLDEELELLAEEVKANGSKVD